MNSLYRVEIDRGVEERKPYVLRASRPCGLPGVECPVCRQTWSITGVAAPAVDCAALGAAAEFRNRWPVSPTRMRELAKTCTPLVGDIPMVPGLDLGPLTGTVTNDPGDLAWVNPWTLLFREDAFTRLRRSVAGFRGVPTGIRSPVPLVEAESSYSLTLHPSCVVEPEGERCSECGYATLPRFECPVIAGAADFARDCVLRIRLFPTYLFITAEVADAITEMGLTGAMLTRVDVR